jgi:hypothetical protein
MPRLFDLDFHIVGIFGLKSKLDDNINKLSERILMATQFTSKPLTARDLF